MAALQGFLDEVGAGAALPRFHPFPRVPQPLGGNLRGAASGRVCPAPGPECGLPLQGRIPSSFKGGVILPTHVGRAVLVSRRHRRLVGVANPAGLQLPAKRPAPVLECRFATNTQKIVIQIWTNYTPSDAAALLAWRFYAGYNLL